MSMDVAATTTGVQPGAPAPDTSREGGARLRRWVVRRAEAVRGRPLSLDERLGVGDLLGVLVERGLMATRGVTRFPGRSPRPFVGRGVRLRSKRRLVIGRGVTLGHGCLVDATSVEGVRLGNGVSVGRNTRIECTGSVATLGRGLVVGDGAGLGADSFYGCAGGVRIGADSIIGNYVSFHSEDHV